MTLKRLHNIIYFNIFVFHCSFQRLVAKFIFGFFKLVGLDSTLAHWHGRKDWDIYFVDELNNEKGGVSLFLADRFVGALQAFLGCTLLNLVSVFLGLEFKIWRYGLIFLFVVIVILNIAVYHPDYPADFRKFRKWSQSEKLKFSAFSLIVIFSIFSVFIASLAWYMSTVINAKALL